MGPSFAYIVGFCTGLLIVFIAALIFALFWKRKHGTGDRYDERQQLARGKAFKAAYAVLLVYLCLNGMISVGAGIEWSDFFTQSVMGVILSVTVFALICIFKDAYLALKDKPVQIILLFIIVAISNLLIGGSNLLGHTLIIDGKLSFHVLSLAVSAMALLILIGFLIKLWIDKRSREVEK